MVVNLDTGAAEGDSIDRKLLTSKFLEEQWNQRRPDSDDDSKDEGHKVWNQDCDDNESGMMR